MSALHQTAEAARIARDLARGVWPDEMPRVDVETAQDILRDAGLYTGEIDGDPGPLTLYAFALAVAAVRDVGTWAYESHVPTIEGADAWAARCVELGLDGVILMLSDVDDAIARVWRLEHSPERYMAAVGAARAAGLSVAFMPWVTPHTGFMSSMIADVIALCDACKVHDVHVDAEGPWRRQGDTDHRTLARLTVAAFAEAGIRTGVSGYPAMAVPGGVDLVDYEGRVVEMSDNDTIDPWIDAIVERGAIGGRPGAIKPQCYSQFDSDHASAVYEPGATQRYGVERWGISLIPRESAERWIALAAYRQGGRPKWSTTRHMMVAWTEAVRLGSHQIPYWSRWWLSDSRQPDVGAFTRDVAARRRAFRALGVA